MQVSTLRTNSRESELVRLEALLEVKSDLFFVYVGSNNKISELLGDSFKSGISAENFTEAKTAIVSAFTGGQAIDFIVVDVRFNEKELSEFNSFLLANDLSRTPVLYNEHQLANRAVALKHYDLIDDVVDLSNGQFDFPSKITFLKKVKQYQVNLKPSKKPAAPQLEEEFNWAKRALDVVAASLLLVLLSPLFLLIAIIIKLESKGPVFYNAKRAGRGFKIFAFHKFRTMEVNADKKIEALAHLNQYNSNDSGPKFFKITNDPRITRFGKFLRNTSLDELPQLFNVVKGEMSLVGNRPLPLYEAATLTTNEFVERFMAPAGITGLWQITKRGKAEMSVEERIKLDISYARKYNLMYDFWIMANTPAALFQKSDV
jgi:lipopolysaccharide/colanic/teichoic acid biosynthesis glycosyltransferase